MIVVDTSSWVDHFRGRDGPLQDVLARHPELLHPFVLGELLLGGLPADGDQATALDETPAAPLASPGEVAAFISRAELSGTGTGYVDTHLLVSARLARGLLLTADQRLHTQAERLGVAYMG